MIGNIGLQWIMDGYNPIKLNRQLAMDNPETLDWCLI